MWAVPELQSPDGMASKLFGYMDHALHTPIPGSITAIPPSVGGKTGFNSWPGSSAAFILVVRQLFT